MGGVADEAQGAADNQVRIAVGTAVSALSSVVRTMYVSEGCVVNDRTLLRMHICVLTE